jgi:hypothetical protein
VNFVDYSAGGAFERTRSHEVRAHRVHGSTASSNDSIRLVEASVRETGSFDPHPTTITGEAVTRSLQDLAASTTVDLGADDDAVALAPTGRVPA